MKISLSTKTTFLRFVVIFCIHFYLAAQAYSQTPTISNFSPMKGPVGSNVTITGTNFNLRPSYNIVFFGATQATVTAATATSLTVTVPTGTSYQYISVTNFGYNLTAYTAQPFNVTLAGGIIFKPKKDISTGTGPSSIAIGDLDGDTKPDIVTANLTNNTVSVLRNTSTSGSVVFATKVDITTGTGASSVTIGEIDGDGKPDLLVTNYSDNTVSVFRNTSTSGTISFATKIDFATGTTPNSVGIGDIDGDGKPDVVTANVDGNNVTVLRNTGLVGSLSFAPIVSFATGQSASSVSIGDIDNDGKPDLAVANYTDNNVSVLRNTSTSSAINFATKIDLTTSSKPYSVSIGDLDGDGKLDLAVTTRDNAAVSVFRSTSSNGTIGFATKIDFTTAGFGTNGVSIGDIDGDGKPDLVTANLYNNRVSVLKNTSTAGSLSMAASADYATGAYPFFVHINDVDGDEKPDLLVANYTGNSLSVVQQGVQPQGSLTANGPFCNSGTGQLIWTATVGTGPYTVVYNDGVSNRTVTNVTSGLAFNVFTNPVLSNKTYTLVSVTDAFNIVRTNGFTGNATTISINPTISATGATVCTNNSLVLGATGGTGYKWTGPNNYNSVAQNPTISTLAGTSLSGVYSVSISNGSTCTATATVNVVVNPNPTASATGATVCAGKSLSLSASGGTDYAWSGPFSFSSASQNPLVSSTAATLMSGIYTVTVANAFSCNATATANVVVNPNPVITAFGATACVGKTLAISASGGTGYSWTGPSNFSSSAQNPIISSAATTAMAGNYNLTVTNTFGCTSTATMSVVVNINPTPTAMGATICAGTSLSVSASGGVGYVWAGSNTFSSTAQNPIISNAATTNLTGIYTVTVANVSGCTSTATANVVVNPNPTAIANSNTPICANVTLNLLGSGGGTYAWAGPLGFSSTQQNPTIANSIVANSGVYTLVVTTPITGCTNSVTTSVTVNPNPTAVANSNSPICADVTLNLSGNGGGTYAWSGQNGFSSTQQNPIIANSIVANSGIYTLVVTTPITGCTNSVTTSVTVNPNPTAIANTNTPICANVTLNLLGSGGGTYVWAGPNGFSSTQQNPNIANSIVANSGVYTLVVTTPITGCTNSVTTSVTVNPIPPIPTPQANTQIIIGGSTSLSATGCSGSLKWYKTSDNTEVSLPVAPIATADYYAKCAITSNGITCISPQSTHVTVTVLIPPIPVAIGTVICKGESTSLTATNCSGTTGNYALKWYQQSDNNLVTMPVTPTETTEYYARCEQTFNGVTAPSGKSNVVEITVLDLAVPVASGATLGLGASVTLTATGCSGSVGTFMVKWYKSADNSSVTMPVSPAFSTQYYAKCEQTFKGLACVSGKSADVTVEIFGRIFVNVANTNSVQDGTTWAKAFSKLPDGLSAADNSTAPNPELWVAKGTYKPTTNLDRNISFELPAKSKIYGGFVGTETALNQRNFRTNETLLSGDIGVTATATDNSYHVLKIINGTNQTVVDGFAIRFGYASNPPALTSAALTELVPTIQLESGAGIYIQTGSPNIVNCTIQNNFAVSGAGIFMEANSTPNISLCLFTGNSAKFGAGVYNLNSSPIISNAVFTGNKGLGGAMYNNKANPILTNLTVANNGGDEGGIFNTSNPENISKPTISNSIIWGNSGVVSLLNNITFSIVEGGYTGLGNLNMNPLFVSTVSNLNVPTNAGNYRILAGSPSTDAGVNGSINLTDLDLDGNLRRFNGGKVDMGAYEYQGISTTTTIMSITSGNWENANTWNVNRVPVATDFVIIDANHTVTVTTTTAIAKNIEYRLNANLKFANRTAVLNTGF